MNPGNCLYGDNRKYKSLDKGLPLKQICQNTHNQATVQKQLNNRTFSQLNTSFWNCCSLQDWLMLLWFFSSQSNIENWTFQRNFCIWYFLLRGTRGGVRRSTSHCTHLVPSLNKWAGLQHQEGHPAPTFCQIFMQMRIIPYLTDKGPDGGRWLCSSQRKMNICKC